MTDMLRREMAPIPQIAWKEIDLQASRILKGNLSGRKLVDFSGPHGWEHAAVNLGTLDVSPIEEMEGVTWGLHKVLPLVEIRVPFKLRIWDLDDMLRGARTPDLGNLKEAAKKAARFEESAIYRGFSAASIHGMLDSSSHSPISIGPDLSKLTESVERALLAIQESEIGGPYALVLGTEPYKWLMAGDPHEYPLRDRILALVNGGIHWSPVLEGGAVLSRRGGDFELTVGQDLSIGYKSHDTHDVELYIAESFAFRVLEPAASVELKLMASS
jgi:uncharacterized linocin/CFP29 family protein